MANIRLTFFYFRLQIILFFSVVSLASIHRGFHSGHTVADCHFVYVRQVSSHTNPDHPDCSCTACSRNA